MNISSYLLILNVNVSVWDTFTLISKISVFSLSFSNKLLLFICVFNIHWFNSNWGIILWKGFLLILWWLLLFELKHWDKFGILFILILLGSNKLKEDEIEFLKELKNRFYKEEKRNDEEDNKEGNLENDDDANDDDDDLNEEEEDEKIENNYSGDVN